MKKKLKLFLLNLVSIFQLFGFDPIKILSLKNYLRFRKNRKEWLAKGGIITKNQIILTDYYGQSGTMKGHYFHQDLLVAKLIYEDQPKRHVDVGSRIDGFVAHVASFREIEVLDIRPLEKTVHDNIKFVQADLMNSYNLGEIDSISCLHVIEHFGLGRYGDPIDIEGHNKGITNLVNLLCKGGRLYLSFPIGRDEEVIFNANRVFQVDTILKHPSIKEFMELVRFDYVDHFGNLHTNVKLENFNRNTKNCCGIYKFKKTRE